jgi:stringent starvation protein B
MGISLEESDSPSKILIMSEISTKPYLLRAIYEWCTDSGYTPHIAVMVDTATQVPMQFVKEGQIVLNISFGATSGLKMDNDSIRFNARFGGVAREIFVPVDRVIAIYANENGQGMAFEVTASRADEPQNEDASQPEAINPTLKAVLPLQDQKNSLPSKNSPDDSPNSPKKANRPTLTRIK